MRRLAFLTLAVIALSVAAQESPDVTEPITFLLVPIAGPVVPRTGTVLLEAAAGDDFALLDVGFYVNGKRECGDEAPPFECAWKKKRHAGRDYSVEVRAEDTSGNIGVSETVVFEVEE